MLIHIVCWKYKEIIDAESRREHIAKLKALPETVPGILFFEVGSDILHLDRSFDTGLVAHFLDRDALDVYTAHPDHQIVAAMGKAISEKAVSVDFLTEAS